MPFLMAFLVITLFYYLFPKNRTTSRLYLYLIMAFVTLNVALHILDHTYLWAGAFFVIGLFGIRLIRDLNNRFPSEKSHADDL